MHRALAVVFAVSLILGTKPAPHLVTGLDHIPIAVRDLYRSSLDFSKLGFLVKPGRLHDDGISNRHIKFPNGSGLELITAASPTDELATEYVDWLKNGDGAAFWSLYSPNVGLLTATLERLNFSPSNKGDTVTFSQTAVPHRLFFADRLRALNDGPVYWAHPNTAYKLQAIWIAGGSGERKLIAALGAQLKRMKDALRSTATPTFCCFQTKGKRSCFRETLEAPPNERSSAQRF